MTRIPSLFFAGLVTALFLTSCAENPADDVAKADVTDPAEDTSASATASPELPAQVVTYVFGEGSKLEFVGSKVTGSHEGGFTNFTGYVNVDVANARLDPNAFHAVMIDMASVYSDNEKLTGHLKSSDFFDVEKYPTARFELNKAETTDGENYLLSGKLELHGVTKAITFPATVVVSEAQDNVAVKADFSINRKDFGIDYPGKADDLIREEVVIRFDVNSAPGEKRALELGGTTGTGETMEPRGPGRGPGGPGGPGGARPNPEEIIANLDTDGDGKISESEAPERAWQFMSRADTDGDGLLSLEELQNRPRREGDGPGPGGGGRRDPAMMLERMDQNKDGKITQDEAPEFFWERLSEADTNGDGGITLEELQALPPREGGPGGPGGGRFPGGGPGGPGGNRMPGGGAGPGQGDTSGGGAEMPTRPPLEE